MALVIANIVGDLVMRCEGREGGCTWTGTTSEFLHHRKHCAHIARQADTPLPTQEASPISSGPRVDSYDVMMGWAHMVFALGVGVIAGAKLAEGMIVQTWAAFAFSLLSVLEPESIFIVMATTAFGIIDMLREAGWVSPTLMILIWCMCIAVASLTPSLKVIAQRPVPPLQVLRIGNMSFATPSYYNLILLAVAGALGFYYMIQDVHRYIVCASLLVLGVMLPFAVRMYRTRLAVDDINTWRHGVDDMGVFYLVASLYAALDIFRSFMFAPESHSYHYLSMFTSWSLILLTTIVVMEACLLGCTTRMQIIAVLVPVLSLAAVCPSP